MLAQGRHLLDSLDSGLREVDDLDPQERAAALFGRAVGREAVDLGHDQVADGIVDRSFWSKADFAMKLATKSKAKS